MARVQYTDEGFPFYSPEEGPGDGVSALMGQEQRRGVDNPLQVVINKMARQDATVGAANRLEQRGVIDKLLGLTGPRFQTWPERMLRSAATAPGEAFLTGQMATRDPYGEIIRQEPVFDPATLRTMMPTLERALDLTDAALVGSIPAAAKGALGMAGGRIKQPTIPKAEQPFYSAVERAVASAPQEKMPAQQWLNWLRNQPGVKQEELDWLGFPEGPQPMTKQQMLEHAQGHGVKIKEIEKTGEALTDEAIGERAYKIMERDYPDVHPDSDDYWRLFDEEAMMKADEELRGGGVAGEYGVEGAGAPKFSDYQLPGGENYREVLLTMPEKKNAPSIDDITRGVEAKIGGAWHKTPAGHTVQDVDIYNKFGQKVATYQNFKTHKKDAAQHLKYWNELGALQMKEEGDFQPLMNELTTTLKDENKSYFSSHWDEPNVLVHMRMNDRYFGDQRVSHEVVPYREGFALKGPEGLVKSDGGGHQNPFKKGQVVTYPTKKDALGMAQRFDAHVPNTGLKALHLEEVQSDWHQAGRKQGYVLERQALLDATIAAEKKAIAKQQMYGESHPDAIAARDNYVNASDRLDAFDRRGAPIPDAPFKSTWADLALKRAISKAAREGYDAISWTPGEQQAARYDLSKQVKEIGVVKNEDGTYDVRAKPIGERSTKKIAEKIAAEKIADYVGKDLAEKAIKEAAEPGKWKIYSGLSLKVGGEGMKRFYDKMLVDKANALAKKFGGKVEWKELGSPLIEESKNIQQQLKSVDAQMRSLHPHELQPDHTIKKLPSGKYIVRGELGQQLGGDEAVFDSPQEALNGIGKYVSLYFYEKIVKPSQKWTDLRNQSWALSERALELYEKHGVGDSELQHYPMRIPILRLTPQMKEAATGRGFPLFAAGLPFTFTPVDYDPFEGPSP